MLNSGLPSVMQTLTHGISCCLRTAAHLMPKALASINLLALLCHQPPLALLWHCLMPMASACVNLLALLCRSPAASACAHVCSCAIARTPMPRGIGLCSRMLRRHRPSPNAQRHWSVLEYAPAPSPEPRCPVALAFAFICSCSIAQCPEALACTCLLLH